MGPGIAGAARDRPIRGRLQLPNQPARVAPRARVPHPGGPPFGQRTACHPPPGIAVDGSPLLQLRQVGRLLGDARPQRIQVPLVQRQGAAAVMYDVLTMRSHKGPRMLDRGLVDIQPPSRGAATQTCRQLGGPAQIRGGLGAEARRGSARARGNQRTAGLTWNTRRVPLPAPRLPPRVGRQLSLQHTLRVATGAGPVVHRGRPSAELICEGYRPDR
jgi:hypothetical protein